MKTIKQIIGWTGKIILYPFHLLSVMLEKSEAYVQLLLPGIYLICCTYVLYLTAYIPYKEGESYWLSNLILAGIGMLFVFMFVIIINSIILSALIWVLNHLNEPFDFFDAWSKAISLSELKGRQAYQNMQRAKTIQEIKNSKAKKKEADFNKGFANAFAEDPVNAEKIEKQMNEWTQWERKKQLEKERQFQEQQRRQQQQRAYEEQQRRQQQQAYEEQRRRAYEEQQRRQREQQQNQQFRTAYDDKLENALTTLHLKKGCSFDEVKNNYRMLAKMFHPDSGNSKFDTNDAQLKINEAYEFLKSYYKQK